MKPIRIAPAPTSIANNLIHTSYPTITSKNISNISLLRRNARERNRVKEVNNRFANLQHHIPKSIIEGVRSESNHKSSHRHLKKISKVDTLKFAVEYIRHLQDQLSEVNSNNTREFKTSEPSTNSKDSLDSIGTNEYYTTSSSSSASTHSEDLCELHLDTTLEPNLFHFESDNASFPHPDKHHEFNKCW